MAEVFDDSKAVFKFAEAQRDDVCDGLLCPACLNPDKIKRRIQF